MWLNENTSETWFQISHAWYLFVNDVTKHVFLNGEGLQTLILILILILRIFATKMLNKQCKSYIRLIWLEMLFILLLIWLINETRDPFLLFTETHLL